MSDLGWTTFHRQEEIANMVKTTKVIDPDLTQPILRLLAIQEQIDALKEEKEKLLDTHDEGRNRIGNALCPFEVGDLVSYKRGESIHDSSTKYKIVAIETTFRTPFYAVKGHKLTKAGYTSNGLYTKKWLDDPEKLEKRG